MRPDPPPQSISNGAKRCPICAQTKSLDAFGKHDKTKDRRQCYCRACQRRLQAEYRRTQNYRDWYQQYKTRPDVRERDRRAQRRRAAAAKETHKRWAQTPRGKLILLRLNAEARLRKASKPIVIHRLTTRITTIATEIDRLAQRQSAI